jgi:hypothetical protein
MAIIKCCDCCGVQTAVLLCASDGLLSQQHAVCQCQCQWCYSTISFPLTCSLKLLKDTVLTADYGELVRPHHQCRGVSQTSAAVLVISFMLNVASNCNCRRSGLAPATELRGVTSQHVQRFEWLTGHTIQAPGVSFDCSHFYMNIISFAGKVMSLADVRN